MVEGVAAFKKKLTVTIPARVEAAARAAMEKSAEELVAMMKRLAPVDTGDLQMSISWTWGKAPEGATVIAESSEDSRGLKITVYAGSKAAYYVRWQEFGTSQMRAHPFFFPSWRALRKRIKSRITREMKKAIQAEAGNGQSNV
ncbi:HK97-gp10 family putative phage morphogenesis protein [Shinella zoogloeoides]|uniref:HK97-gp10 family putative phage morphogenesis protein n=1 Tax=Shinella zoogloeoides TaxID=352475 RepID=UPI001F5A825D|nr:HK97-gp10 family putative phage morphogenesis protein [Shinella zoogloeoides]